MNKSRIRVLAVVALVALAGGCAEDNNIVQIIGDGGVEAAELAFELTWDGDPGQGDVRPDLDIFVIDPLGQTFSWSAPGSTPSFIDQDDTGDCGGGSGGETITLSSPLVDGQYAFGIHYARECDADEGIEPRPEAPFTMRVFVDGNSVATRTGTAVSQGGLTRIPVGVISVQGV